MVGASKILTVSYGTFSCTLEGFDEPFSTMKAIAEYFRDLAADDRYFGAEPPTPDAEMLHRIAEREIQRRVEAKINEHGVVLKAQESPAPLAATQPVSAQPALTGPAPAQPAGAEQVFAEPATARPVAEQPAAARPPYNAPSVEAAAPEVQPAAPVVVEALPPVAAEPAAAAFVTAPDLGPEATPDLGPDPAPLAIPTPLPGDDSIAAKLLRIRAAVAQSRGTAAAPTARIYAEDLDAEDGFGPASSGFASDFVTAAPIPDFGYALDPDPVDEGLAALAAAAADGPTQTAAEALAAPAEAFAGPADILPPRAETAAEATDTQPQDSADLSDMLARIAAVAPLQATETAAALVEDGSAAEVIDTRNADSIEAVILAEDAIAEVSEEEETAEPSISDSPAIDGAATWVLPIEAADADQPAIADKAVDSMMAADAPVEDGMSADEATAVEPAPAETPKAATAADRAPADDDQPADPAEADILEALREVEVLRPTRARVIKIRREDYVPGASAPAASAPAPTTPAADPLIDSITASLGQTSLSPEDEADLMAELADVAREAEAARRSESRSILEGSTSGGEDAIARLFEQTKSELAEPENQRRLSAIAHLKAAVAATEADKEMGGSSAKAPTELDRYRDDLAQVVRPRRPEATAAPTRRPMLPGDRPAPLVLVSAQRIDRPAGGPPPEPAVIRPRRVMTNALALDDSDDDDLDDMSDEAESIFEDSSSFAEFADRIGATGLSDLLEAAAAYAAYVEKRPHFSRPQILQKVARFTAEDSFNREDGLRSFGMLLRQGKIQKVKRGQFAIAKTSRFIPEARRMAQ